MSPVIAAGIATGCAVVATGALALRIQGFLSMPFELCFDDIPGFGIGLFEIENRANGPVGDLVSDRLFRMTVGDRGHEVVQGFIRKMIKVGREQAIDDQGGKEECDQAAEDRPVRFDAA